jgi:transcription initiation factor TFIIA large subunit
LLGHLQIKKENDGDEDLGSDLDDEEGEEPDTDNIALCQFEKVRVVCRVSCRAALQVLNAACEHVQVTRIKNKRKCNLKAGVMHLNGRDYLFNRANGEFEW